MEWMFALWQARGRGRMRMEKAQKEPRPRPRAVVEQSWEFFVSKAVRDDYAGPPKLASGQAGTARLELLFQAERGFGHGAAGREG